MENTENNSLIIEQGSKNSFQLTASPLFGEDDLFTADSIGNTLPKVDELSVEMSLAENDGDYSLFPKTVYDFDNLSSLESLKLDFTDSSTRDMFTGASTIDASFKLEGEKERFGNSSNTGREQDFQEVFYQSLEQAVVSLLKFNQSDNFDSVINRSFGLDKNYERVREEISAIANGEADIKFELVWQAQLGAKGGYARSNNTIFLAEEFLEQSDRNIDAVAEVILEEIGHYLDHRLNETDTDGDEGAIFAALSLGKEIDPQQLSAIKQEDDSATIIFDERILEIEQAEDISLSNRTASVSGTLQAYDSQQDADTGKYYDDYQLSDISVGDNLTINLVSSEFDAYLELINADTGELINDDDDSFDGVNDTDSQLVFTVEPDINYLIRTTSYGEQETGSYQLNLEVEYLPDLKVTKLNITGLDINDTDAFKKILAGESREINWSVASQGNSEIDRSWRDELYLSRDAVLDTTEDVLLTNLYKSNTSLSQGNYDTSILEAFTFSLPSVFEFEDGYENLHLIIKTDARNNVDESNEDNNTQAIPIKLLAPDLDVIDFKVPPSATVHETIPVSWTVDNLEDALAAAKWSDAVFLSDDKTLNYEGEFLSIVDETGDGENDIFVESFFISEDTFEEGVEEAIVPLSGSAGYKLTKNITLPNTSPGSKYLIFATDIYSSQLETNESNNLYVAPIELSGVDVDLGITGKSSATKVSLGDTIDLEWTVANSGSDATVADISNSTHVFVLDDPFLGDTIPRYRDFVTLGDTSQESKPIKIRNDIKPGDRYLLFVTDFYNEQNETNETNNVHAIPITIEAPNLKVTKVEGLGSKVFDSGSSVEATWTVINESNTDANASWYDTVYISTDEILDYGDYSLNSQDDPRLSSESISNERTPLAGKTYTKSTTLDLPDEAGKYYLLFNIDNNQRQGETDELDNVYSVPIEIVASDVDLEIEDFNVQSIVSSEGKIPFDVTVKNSGSTPVTSGTWSDRIYLSRDDKLNPNKDILLSPESYTRSEISEQSYSYSGSLNRENIDAGNYYLIIDSDYEDEQKESNEENNTKAIPFKVLAPDLAFAAIDVPSNIVIDSTIPISWTIENSGDKPVYEEGWYDSIYLSDDRFFDDEDDEYLDEFERDNISPLQISDVYEQKTNLTIKNTALGDRYLLFIIDEYESILETNEANNVLAIPIELLDAPPVISEISRTNNEITGALEGEDIYSPSRKTRFSDDYRLADVTEGKFVSLELTSTSFDTYLELIDADTKQVLAENNDAGSGLGTNSKLEFTVEKGINYLVRTTSNNSLAVGDYTLKYNLLPNLKATNITAPKEAALGDKIKVSWTVNRDDEEANTKDWVDRLYLSKNNTLSASDTPIHVEDIVESNLDADGNYSKTAQITLSSNALLNEGKNYILLETDTKQQVVENNETDNLIFQEINLDIPDFQYTDLGEWQQQGSLSAGNWNVTGEENQFVKQFINGSPTFFVSPFNFIDGQVTGTFKVETSFDNDYIGFVFGYQSPIDKLNDSATDYEFLLFDWRQSPQGGGKEGFALSRLTPSNSVPDLWGRNGEGLEFIASDYGSAKGWVNNREYDFNLTYTKDRIVIEIDDQTIFDVEGSFEPGRFGFYNYSQSDVRYGNFRGTGLLETRPIAEEDTYTVNEDESLVVSTTEGLLINDSNPNLGVITVENVVETTKFGNLDVNEDGSFSYTPNSNFAGLDSFTYRAYDGSKFSEEATVNIRVNNVDNDAPTNIELSSINIDENSSLGTTVGILNTIDFDPDDVHAYELIDDAGGRFSLVQQQPPGNVNSTISEIKVADSALLNAEADISHDITLRSTDAGGLSREKTITININDINEAPTQIQLSNNNINERSVNGATVGIFNTEDPDNHETHSYQLINNSDGLFAIANNNQLVVADEDKLDFETQINHELIVRTIDSSGLFLDRTIKVNVDNEVEIDLVADKINIPILEDASDNLVSGTTVPITWTVENQGDDDTKINWRDRIYLSNNTTFEAGTDRLIGEYEHQSSLAEDATVPAQADVLLPEDISGNRYILIVSDADNELKELAGENNNVANELVSIEQAPYADLLVSDVKAPNLTIDDPATVKVSWKVTNEGTGTGYSNTWTDLVIASKDNIPGNGDDIVLGEYEHTGALAVNESYPGEAEILLPPAFSGRYNLFVQTDSGTTVFENDLEDNNYDKKTEFFDVMTQPYADLNITQLKTKGEAKSGDPITVSWNVVNEGIGLTNSSYWSDSLSLASDPEGKNIIADLGSFEQAGALAVDKSYNRSVNVTLPEGIKGEHYIVALTGGPFEFVFKDNNTVVSKAFDVKFTPTPDLEVTNIIAPEAIEAGKKIDLTWTVKNKGEGKAEERWTDSVYLREVGKPNASLIPLKTYRYDRGLESGKSYTRKEKILMPSELQGVYRVVIQTNSSPRTDLFEPNKDNNQTVDNKDITLSLPPRPDLKVDSIEVAETASAGGTVTAEFTVINQGTVDTTVPNWTDAVYLSLDNQISSDDLLIDVFDNGSALKKEGDRYKTKTEPFVIPKRFRGDAFIIVETDNRQQVNEFPQESNNTKFKKIEIEFDSSATGGSGQPSDLVTSNVIAPDQAFEGSTIEVTYKVTNRGTDTTDVDRWSDYIWLTRDKNRPSAVAKNTKPGEFEDILLETVSHTGALAVDGVDNKYERTVKVKIPSQITGEWYITPWADAFDLVLEDTLDVNINPDDPNELDNNNYKARPITLLLTPPPDLRIKDKVEVSATPKAVGGDSFDVTWTVENFGSGETRTDTWYDRIFLSDNPDPEAVGAKKWSLGTIKHTGSLIPRATYTQTANFDLSPAAFGKYVHVDVNAPSKFQDPIWEGPYTKNNFGTTKTDVTNSPADLVVNSVKLPAGSDSGEKIVVEWSVENTGAPMWSETEFWHDQVYISPDPIFRPKRAIDAGSFVYSPDAPLGKGDTYTQKKEITLPAGIDGEYYVYVTTNTVGGLSLGGGDNEGDRESYFERGFEDPTNNQNSSSLPVVYKEPDLKITELKLPETHPQSGDTIPISWITTNDGTRETRSSIWYDRVYLSPDSSFDFNDTLIGSQSREGFLDIDQSYPVTPNVRIPDNIEGDFYILAFTDSNVIPRGKFTKLGGPDSTNFYEIFADNKLARIGEYQDEGNNITVEPIEIIRRDPPDLQVTKVDVPDRATVGQDFRLQYTVTNLGDGNPTQNSWNDRVYLSRDEFLDVNSDIYLTSFNRTKGLASGKSYSVSEPVELPTNIDEAFYVFVITDPALSPTSIGVFEGGLDFNNSRPSDQPMTLKLPPPADLEVETIKVPENAFSGDQVKIEWTVKNKGDNPAEGRWSDSVYLSTDAVWDINDIPLGRQLHTGNIAPGKSYPQTLETILPPAAPGQYRIIVRPDIYDQVHEGNNEANNQTASGDPVNVTVQKLNLGVVEEAALSTGQSRLYSVEVGAGETLRVSIDSKSDNAANEVFIKQGAIPTATDFDYSYRGGLDADQHLVVPTTEPGKYYVLVKGYSQPSNNTATDVLAEALPFSITDVVIDRGGDSKYVTASIYGAKFDSEAIVKFVRPGIAEYQPVSYEVIDATHIIAIFDFTDAPRGLYDAKVINADGEEAIVPYRYLVERAIETDVTVGLGGSRVLSIGDTGLYGTSFKSLTNVDTPYIHFQYGVPELGDNDFLLGRFSPEAQAEAGIEELPYVGFSTNLRGVPAEASDEIKDLPWASLKSEVNTDGEIFAPGYIYDLPNASATGLSFNATAYPGLKELLKIEPDALAPDKIEKEDHKKIAFQFHIQASATVLTRDEFVAQQTQSALNLRDAILQDTEATPSLQVLAADPDIWVAAYLGALEEAGLLRPEEDAPPVRERTQVLSYMATLATGILVGAAGAEIITDGELLSFFAQLRLWYGHDEDLTGVSQAKDVADYDLGTSKTTHQEAFDIYVPFRSARVDLPLAASVADPDFDRFLNVEGEAGLANITGPISVSETGFIPTGETLPYTIEFANDPNASSTVGEIRVVTELDPNLDPRRFRLGDIELGDIVVNIPEGRATFEGDFDFTATKGFILRVSAGADPLSNTATWLLQAIDPETGEVITNPDLGILPPNDGDGAGVGFIGYSSRPLEGVATGTEISASARVLYSAIRSS